jgi:hypothetical protein
VRAQQFPLIKENVKFFSIAKEGVLKVNSVEKSKNLERKNMFLMQSSFDTLNDSPQHI